MAGRSLDQVSRAAERRDHALEALRRRAAVECVGDSGLGGRRVLGKPADLQQLRRERDHDLVQARVARGTGQVVERLPDLQGVAGAAPEHLIHVGDQGAGPQAGALGDRDDALGQGAGVVHLGHEGAAADLDVHHQALQPGGQLLGEDRRGDQGDGLHRRGDVADRVEALVGWGQVGGLADDRTAGLGDRPPEGLDVRLRPVAGNGVQLVEGATGMAQAAARDHRHRGAAGGQDRGQGQADLVADAAGRMLVQHRPLFPRPVQHPARGHHGAGQGHALLALQAPEKDRHGEGRRLALGDRAVGDPGDEGRDLLGRQAAAVALAADHLLRQEAGRAHAPGSRAASTTSSSLDAPIRKRSGVIHAAPR